MSDCIYCGNHAGIVIGGGTKYEYHICGRCPECFGEKPKRRRKVIICKFCNYDGDLDTLLEFIHCPICGGVWHTDDGATVVEPSLDGHLSALKYHLLKPFKNVLDRIIRWLH